MFGKKTSYTDKNKLFNAQFTVFACSCVAFNGFLTFVTRKNRHFLGVQAVVFVTTIVVRFRQDTYYLEIGYQNLLKSSLIPIRRVISENWQYVSSCHV